MGAPRKCLHARLRFCLRLLQPGAESDQSAAALEGGGQGSCMTGKQAHKSNCFSGKGGGKDKKAGKGSARQMQLARMFMCAC